MHETQAAGQIRIGELAAQVGLNPKTIRYYEDIGVLPPPQRTAAGYRLYTADARMRLQFIRQAKAVGFTLAEIRDILALKQAGHAPCTHVQALVAEKIVMIDVQLRALHDVRHELAAIQAAASQTRVGEAEVCGMIEHAAPRRATVIRPG